MAAQLKTLLNNLEPLMMAVGRQPWLEGAGSPTMGMLRLIKETYKCSDKVAGRVYSALGERGWLAQTWVSKDSPDVARGDRIFCGYSFDILALMDNEK